MSLHGKLALEPACWERSGEIKSQRRVQTAGQQTAPEGNPFGSPNSGPASAYTPATAAMNAATKIKNSLRGRDVILGVAGEPGAGKLHAAQLACQELGFQTTILDRTQGAIQYNRLGPCALADGGLARIATIVCGADAETAWPDPSNYAEGTKLLFIANDVQHMKKAPFPLVRLDRPSADAMAKILFLDQGWPATRATRLAKLAAGDWRQLGVLQALFKNTDMDNPTDDEFQQLLQGTKKDQRPLLDAPPSAAVHQLFSGYAAASNTVDDYADHSVLVWAEANKDVVCNSIEEMAALQAELAVSDVLMAGGENQLGLETFARAAANAAKPNLRYDFTKYRNPWATRKDTPAAVEIRKSWMREGPFSKRERARLASTQERGGAPPDKPARKRGAPTGTTKSAAKHRASPKT